MQKKIKITPKNILLAEFLFKNKFVSGKNALHYQSLGDSYSIYKKKKDKASNKMVSFQSDLIIEKPLKQLCVNFTRVIVSTYYCTSLQEISLLRE